MTVTPNGGSDTSETGTLLHVVRDGPYGKGWWLAGLERLRVLPDNLTLMWIGGDGSTRLYTRPNTGQSYYEAETRGRADKIVTNGTSAFVREVIGGGEVHFNSSGYHQKTVSRTGITTEFVGTGDQITAIKVEGETIFDLDYTSGQLTKVKVIDSAGTGWDAYTITDSSGKLTSITAPDGRDVDFSYRTSDDKLETITTDGFGSTTVTTTLSYVHDKVSEVRASSSGYSDIVVDYDPVSVVGVNGSGTFAPAVVGEVSALIDGPRPSSVGDTTRLFVTGWGAVRGTRDALGNETWIHYENASYPGLPTRVRHPNGWEVTASYHSNGLLDEVTDRSNGGVTAYEWNTTWSQPTKITSAEGVVTEFSYNGSGDRTKRKVGADSVLYAYNGDGQVTKITDGEGNETTLAYDSDGNLESETGPTSIGSWTHYSRDGRGYATHMGQATGTASDSTIVTKTFDEVGRVTESLQTTSADAMWLRTTHTYDTATGLKTETEAWGGATANDSTTTGTTEWEYDPFGRVIVKDLPKGRDSLVYDLAGNVEERILLGWSGSPAITMTYDALHRLTQRIIPSHTYNTSTTNGYQFPYWEADRLSISGSTVTVAGDTVTFSYDAMGNVLTANNRASHVTRTYSLNGALKSDQQALRSYGSTSFTTHVYDLAHDYNLDGQRTALHHPSWLSSGSDRTQYFYSAANGRLTSVVDAISGSYDFTYNGNGQPTEITFPSGTRELWYDDAGRVDSLHVSAGGSALLANSMNYDKSGRVTDADGGASSSVFTYNGFGHVMESNLYGSAGEVYEYFERDAFGSATLHHSFPPWQGLGDVPGSAFDKTYYSTAGGAADSDVERWEYSPSPSEPTNWEPGTTSYGYDGRGNVLTRIHDRYSWSFSGGSEGYDNADMDAAYEHAAKSYYSADEQLVVHQIVRDSADHTGVWPDTVTYGDPWGVYEEYWYDALGRRVLKRSRQDSPICTYSARCYSSTTRFVWDGNQILWELRQYGSGNTKNPTGSPYTGKTGNIGYVHAGGIDAPLGMVRNGYTVVLHRNWRGLYETATEASNGTEIGSDVPWPGVSWSTTQTFQDLRETHTWVGSLSMGQQDNTGLNYRRNRYYDSASGQFTQQDPIGIAGGLNVYGYANGDPVNFSDPFGLCPPWPECLKRANEIVATAVALFGGADSRLSLGSLARGQILRLAGSEVRLPGTDGPIIGATDTGFGAGLSAEGNAQVGFTGGLRIPISGPDVILTRGAADLGTGEARVEGHLNLPLVGELFPVEGAADLDTGEFEHRTCVGSEGLCITGGGNFLEQIGEN